MNKEKAILIRKFVNNGKLIVLWPYVPSKASKAFCESFTLYGGFSPASVDLRSTTIEATPDESEEILEALNELGYSRLEWVTNFDYDKPLINTN